MVAARLALLSVDDTTPAPAMELQRLSHRLGLPVLSSGTDPVSCDNFDALLILGADGLSLQRTGRKAPGPVSVDFGSASMRHRRGAGHNELLGKAVGVGSKAQPPVLDATAGLGRDSFVLADLGCQVVMCEREPLIAALLRSGLERAGSSGDPWLRAVASRMELCEGEVRDLPVARLAGLEVIYLDPMFPARDKRAAVKKEMALFQLLLGELCADTDSEDLLHWAMQQDVARVVVKRPVRGASLGGVSPSHAIAGKSVRYDVYVKRKLA
jgi:16S rRNA (guanine1516-N2)-methyltransferase